MSSSNQQDQHDQKQKQKQDHHQKQQKHAIICAGLNCLDLQLLGCTKSDQEEAIEQYEQAVYCAGGSASMTATTLSQIITADNSSTSTEIYIVTKLGRDPQADILLDFYHKANINTSLVLQKASAATALSVLPIFKTTGGRGCFFNLASNRTFDKHEMIQQLQNWHTINSTTTTVDAFLFGYPHLMPLLQGEHLKDVLCHVKESFGGNDVIIGVDLNGVSRDNHSDSVLTPALPFVDVLHLNEEEAEILSGTKKQDFFLHGHDEQALQDVCNLLHNQGCKIVLLSRGRKGCFISGRSQKKKRNTTTTQTVCQVPAIPIEDGKVNANGAGDALFSGFCYVMTQTKSKSKNNLNLSLSLAQMGVFATLVARQRCNVETRDHPKYTAEDLLQLVLDVGTTTKYDNDDDDGVSLLYELKLPDDDKDSFSISVCEKQFAV